MKAQKTSLTAYSFLGNELWRHTAVSAAVAFFSIFVFSCLFLPGQGPEYSLTETQTDNDDIALENKDMGLQALPVEACSGVNFCSHRGRGSPYTEGSEKAIDFMFAHNVTCFDLDVIQSKDGTLFIGHPKSLASEKAIGDVFQLTAAELRSEFGNRLLSVDHFFSLLTASFTPALKVTLEPKTAPENLAVLETLSALIAQHGLHQSVSVIVLDGEGAPSRGQGSDAAFQRLLAAGVSPALAVHDPRAAHPPPPRLAVPPREADRILFAVAALLDPALFNLTGPVRSGRTVAVYGTEDASLLPELVQRGASAIISDDPLRLRDAWERQCRAGATHAGVSMAT